MKDEIKEIIYMPTLRCNLVCKHCTVKHFYKEEEEMTCLQVLDRIKTSTLVSKCHVSIGGGEVFLKKDLGDLILGLVNDETKEWFVDVTTNGYFVDRIKNIVERVNNPDRLRFSISIDGIEQTHNLIRGNQSAYENVMKSLEIVASYGIHAEVNAVMQPDNFTELAEMKKKFDGMDEMIRFTPIPMMVFSNSTNTFAFKDDEIEPIFPYIRNNIDMKGVISKGDFRLKDCHASLCNLVIDPIGKVFPCAYIGQLMMDSPERDAALIGNLKDQTIDQIFCSKRKEEVYNNIVKKCLGCNHNCDLYREQMFFNLTYSVSEQEASYVFKNVKTLNAVYDFHWEPVEYENGKSFRWMNTSKARIYLKNSAGASIKVLFKSMYDDMNVGITVGMQTTNEIVAYQGMNEVEVPLDVTKNELVVVDFGVEKTWIPAEMMDSQDERTLGIALYEICIIEEVEERTMESIDVAKIMAEITAEAQKRYDESALLKRQEKFSYEDEILKTNGEFSHKIKAQNHLLAFEIAKMHALGDIPWKTPDYEWRGVVVRKPLKFISRVVSKLSRFITVRQKDVNDTLTASVEMLQASMLNTADWSQDIELRLNALTKAIESQESYDQVDMLDQMYLRFEEKHRGNQADLKKQQNFYYEKYVKEEILVDTIGMVIDLGCGRGEWLSVLKERGYDCTGVDLNVASLKCCEMNGISTVNMNIIDYLKTLPRNSVKLLTSFQLIEHITTNKLMELFREIGRVMRKGGVVIIETPNPINLNVGAASFYLDPTHKRPIHPDLLRFLAEENGLEQVEIDYWQKEEIEKWWESIYRKDNTDIAKSNIFHAIEDTLMKSIWCSADYAMIARK